jgi:hypothetical protein
MPKDYTEAFTLKLYTPFYAINFIFRNAGLGKVLSTTTTNQKRLCAR